MFSLPGFRAQKENSTWGEMQVILSALLPVNDVVLELGPKELVNVLSLSSLNYRMFHLKGSLGQCDRQNGHMGSSPHTRSAHEGNSGMDPQYL